MTRSIWKNPFSDNIIFKNVFLNKSNQKLIIIWSRNCIIFPAFIGNIFAVYNGKKFVNLQVHEEMVGYKFGDFVPTRKKAIHKKK